MTDQEEEPVWADVGAALEEEFGSSPPDAHQRPVEIVTVSMLRKRMVWNTSPCSHAERVSALMGMSPASPDVEEREHEACHERINAIQGLSTMIGPLSMFAAEAIRSSMIVEYGEESVNSNLPELAPLQTVIGSAAIAIIAELVDMKLLNVPRIGMVRDG